MRETHFELCIVAQQGILMVSMRVPPHAQLSEIEAVKSRVATAFALTEKVAADRLRELCWQKLPSRNQLESYVLTRSFSDPDYPNRFAVALQFFASQPNVQRLH